MTTAQIGLLCRIRRIVISHPNGTQTENFIYYIGDYSSKPYASLAIAKAQQTIHYKKIAKRLSSVR
jgi:hypothetical protein